MNSGADDEAIRARLATPRAHRDKGTVSDLISRHFDAIQDAHAKRGAGKTWEEIGRDLRPADPIPGDTVSKAVRRMKERMPKQLRVAGKKASGKETAPEAAPPTDAAAAYSSSPPSDVASKNPFRQSIDPY